MALKVDIDTNYSRFRISGPIDNVLSKKRILGTLRRLKYSSDKSNIYIPFDEEAKVQILNEIQEAFDKNKLPLQVLSGANNELKLYKDEQDNFKIFSEKAELIRDNKFSDNLDLIHDFDNFQRVIKKELIRTLYDLQLLSAFHMSFSQNSCNFSVPGAGKTSIVYAAYAYLKSLPLNDSRHVDKLVIVGPISSFSPWEIEFENCFGRKPTSFRLSGDDDIIKSHKLEHLYSPQPSELTLIFHGGVESLKDELLDFLERNRTMLVVDEAHKIKNPDGVWGKSITDIAQVAVSRVALTGTPAPNGYQDLYNIFKFIHPYKYKQVIGFNYGQLEDLTNKDTSISSDKIIKLRNNLSPFFIRIKKSDLKLPEVREEIHYVDMHSYQREIYDFIESKYIKHFRNDSSATVKDILNKAKLIRLRQAATDPSLLSKSLKKSISYSELTDSNHPDAMFLTDTNEYINDSEFFKKIIDYINLEVPAKFTETLKLLNNEILIDDAKCIIWTIFIDNALRLKDYLLSHNIEAELLIGQVKQEEREEIIAKFNNPMNQDFNVVIANPFSVAESISLHHGCHNAIYLEKDYNCSNFLQSKDRIHRVGLNPNQITHYHYIVSKDSIDEVIHNKLQVKIERMEEIINDDLPLFELIDNDDETDLIQGLIKNYADRASKI
jgi:SNF2 family DNA or RNA helicase